MGLFVCPLVFVSSSVLLLSTCSVRAPQPINLLFAYWDYFYEKFFVCTNGPLVSALNYFTMVLDRNIPSPTNIRPRLFQAVLSHKLQMSQN
jgi:hypothetical protein